MESLTHEAIDRHLQASAWRREDKEIVSDRDFPDFAAAIAFVNQVADAAEAANHHPDILIHGWNRVRLTLTDHSAGELTTKDLELADNIDGLH